MIAARIERIYIACVSFALGAAGTAIGFTLGVIPYFRISMDLSQNDWFLTTCVVAGSFLGFIAGVANAPKWYRSAEESPVMQRRMMAYLKRRALDGRDVPQRTLRRASLRHVVSSGPPPLV